MSRLGPASAGPTGIRHVIRVRGTVQGVGFRPAVYRAAIASRLGGFVRNDSEGVLVEVEGPPSVVEAFPDAIRRSAPPLARIDAIEVTVTRARGDRDFHVTTSAEAAVVRAMVPTDTATCDACVRELFDPEDRRFRYPFIVCTSCGPRYTIVRDLPYDRARTTMAGFVMCAACREEYEDPTDRRFHAEPVACASCGPRVALVELGGGSGAQRRAEGDEAIVRAAALLRRGAILAVKGIGGYQLAVDARDDAAVRRLRERKRRPHKAFALMARNLAALEGIVELAPAARAALIGPAHPIVLVPKRDAGVAPSVAPRLRELGVLLPTTPLHHLLLAEGPPVLVMTSGNVSDEPIAADDDDALARLGSLADAFLVHDRPIHTRADDSVGRVVAGAIQPVRRARGWAPESVALGFDAPDVLAVGAELKSTVCFTRGGEAFVSQHIGDLGSLEARDFFGEVIARLERLLGVIPIAMAHDLHPDYTSTRWALACGTRTIAVQHHHAHVASCLVENGTRGPAIGIAFDGTGCGPAGDLWGGEVLVFDLERFERIGHLRPIALAGGEAAIREPWRLAVAALLDAGEPLEVGDLGPDARRRQIRALIEKGIASPLATGAGRWFDAVAALVGVRDAISYEGQAAIELEALAGTSEAPPYPFEIEGGTPFEIDLRPAIRAIAADLRRHVPPAAIASRFHSTMAEAVLASCRSARRTHGTDVVALSGGCFQNVLLTEGALRRLDADGFRPLVHRRVPPNDGGVALGQAAIAAHRLVGEAGG